METKDITRSENESPERVGRRQLLTGSGALKAAGVAMAAVALSRRAQAQLPTSLCRLIVVYLRGGMDSLSAVFPFGDSTYTTLRQALALADPSPNGNLDLDGTFGLSKAAEDLKGPFDDDNLAFIQGAGSPTPIQSHFAAQDASEIGIELSSGLPQDGKGWLGRYLSETPPSVLTLDGLGFEVSTPLTLKGGPKTLAIPNPESFDLNGDSATLTDRKARLQLIYQQTDDPAMSAGLGSLQVIDDLAQVDFSPTVGAYPSDPFGFGDSMRRAAALLRYDHPVSGPAPDFGPRGMLVDFGGWDDHKDQGPTMPGGKYYDRLQVLAKGLRAFYDEMADYESTQGVTIPYHVVVMSEFGRRVDMNGNDGSDHGRGGLMIAMGNAGVRGGKVYTRLANGMAGWAPAGLTDQLDGQSGGTTQNLLSNISWWDVIAEYLVKRCGVPQSQVTDVFPGYSYNPLRMFT